MVTPLINDMEDSIQDGVESYQFVLDIGFDRDSGRFDDDDLNQPIDGDQKCTLNAEMLNDFQASI